MEIQPCHTNTYFVGYMEEMVFKTKLIEVSSLYPFLVTPNQAIEEIKKQLGNTEIISIGRL